MVNKRARGSVKLGGTAIDLSVMLNKELMAGKVREVIRINDDRGIEVKAAIALRWNRPEDGFLRCLVTRERWVVFTQNRGEQDGCFSGRIDNAFLFDI